MHLTQQTYIAKKPDHNDFITYDKNENNIWRILFERQLPLLKARACPEYLEGLNALQLPTERIPQCFEINLSLKATTGWRLHPVPVFISTHTFFSLLSTRHFPVATFIRSLTDLDYIQQPDIFHELIGHCPLLMNEAYANFLHQFAIFFLAAKKSTQHLLEKIFFFTIETGLIKSANCFKIYGGGILSSKNEMLYALDSDKPQRKAFDVDDVIKQTFNLKFLQTTYYYFESFATLSVGTLLNLVNAH